MVAHARRSATPPETLEAGEIMEVQERVPTASSVFALQELNGTSDAVTLMCSCPTQERQETDNYSNSSDRQVCYAGVRTVADLRAPALALGGIALSGPFLRAVS